MPFLNLDLDFFDHPKTKRLVGLLGRGADILPIRLWCYCGKYQAENGDLTGYSPTEIETLMGWWGQPGRALDAMLLPFMGRPGFLERTESGYKVHDWEEINGHISALKGRAKAAAKARWDKVRSDVDAQAMLKHCLGNAPGNAPSTPSLPSINKENTPQPPEGEESGILEAQRRAKKVNDERFERERRIGAFQTAIIERWDAIERDYPGVTLVAQLGKAVKFLTTAEPFPENLETWFLERMAVEFQQLQALQAGFEKFPRESIEYESARFFWEYLKEWAPTAKPPDEAKFQAWAKVFDAMYRLDHRTPAQYNELMEWMRVQKPEKSGFLWRKNILSPEKLRKRWNEGKFIDFLPAELRKEQYR